MTDQVLILPLSKNHSSLSFTNYHNLIVCLFQCFIRSTTAAWSRKLWDFLDYLNNRQNNIQFTTEGHLPSLDTNNYSKENSSLGHKSTQETNQQKPLPDCKITPPSNMHTHIHKVNMFTIFHLNP
jgi:hypothetical protein